jgi:ATP-binding cassette subfamily B protein
MNGNGDVGRNTAPIVDPFRSLRVENLSVVTNVGTPVLSNISLKIHSNEFVVVTGKVGAGKTTLLKSINGLVHQRSGALFWNDQPIDSVRQLMVPPHCAYVPQVPNMFNESVLANILMGVQVDQAVVEKAIYDAVFDDDLHRLERGDLTLVGGRGANLSGGQIKRIAIARGLVRTPEILLCDDVSSGLDIVTEEALWERIVSRRGMTCIAVSHRRAAFTRATQIIVLDAGRIVGMGSFEGLKTSCPQFQDILHGS